MERAWSHIGLTVQVATKLNRSHLFLARMPTSCPASGGLRSTSNKAGQVVTIEDSTSCI